MTGFVERFVGVAADGPVLEIGAGTGIFTGQLLAAGLEVIAVEPVEAMRAVLASNHPGVDVRAGTAEDLPVASGTVDSIVVAQAFHWFDHEQALDEIGRALRPGGHLVTVWNVKDGDADWYRRFMAIVNRYADDTPRHADLVWRRAIDRDPRFTLVDDWSVDNSRPADLAAIVERALSTSFIAALPPDEREAVARKLRTALADVDFPVRFPYRGELQAWVTADR